MSKTAPSSGTYVDHVAKLERRLSTDDALRKAVGGEFVAVGKLEYHFLRSRGLKDHHLVVDVGCGSGRLAYQLAPFPGISLHWLRRRSALARLRAQSLRATGLEL